MDRPEASSSSGKRKRSTGSNEKKPSPTCLFFDYKHRKVGTSDPFASRDYVTKFDSSGRSSDYGSATKVMERFFSLKKTILTKFPPPSGDLANLKDRENSLNVNDTNISTKYLVDDNKHKKVVDFSDPFALRDYVNDTNISTRYLVDDNKHKKLVDFSDPFVLRDYVTASDSPAYGSATKDVEHFLAMPKMMSLPRFPSTRGDFVNLKARDQDSLNVKDTKEVIVISSDDDDDDDDNDETTHPRPFQLEQNVAALTNLIEQFPGTSVLMHDETMRKSFGDESKSLAQIYATENRSDIDGQVSTQKCSGKDAAEGQAFIGGGVTTTSYPNVVAWNNLFEQLPGTSVMVHDKTMWKSFGDESKSLSKLYAAENKSNIDGQVSTRKCSGKGDVQGQAFIRGGVTTTSDPNVVASNNLFEQFPGTSVMVHDKLTRFKSFVNKFKSLAQIYAANKNKSDIDGQVSTQKCSGKGVVQGQAFIGGGVTTTSDPNVEKGKSIEDNAVVVQNDKSIEYDDVESEDDTSTEDDDDVMVEEDESDSQSNIDPNEDIWNEMQIGLESSKEIHPVADQKPSEDEQECDHSYILRDDIGYVCRVCGMVQTPINSIIEYQRPKTTKSIRTYYHEGRNNNPRDASLDGVKLAETDFSARELTVHPRHKKQMKPHQVEGFNFLLSNLVSDNPGGCILAHAPGSGKTFLLISFIQSFMAKYPDARPLVVLPRGILGTWKKEFVRWQVEDTLLLDMYSAKADGRVQQLEVLKKWANQRSILFLGYQQFSSIACDIATTPASISCQDLLINCPSLLILDEGHTPRNKETNVFTALDKVKTPMKVVLSGTLFQNHVTEVFNILNLVRPKFLKMEKSKAIKRRIMSRVEFKSHVKKGTDSEFYDLVERTLVKDNNFKRKAAIIEDLREMTGPHLHYYKGDMLDELPGLVDFSVFLKLTPNQAHEVVELKKAARNNTFTVMCDGSATYVHPKLRFLFKNKGNSKDVKDSEIDEMLEKEDGIEGVKAKFFINMLRLCESAGEKLLVFSQYLLPLKFLVRLTVKTMGWSVGKEIFMITGGNDNDAREVAMDQFNNSSESRVFFGSIRACGEGISLVGASRIIILDVPLNPSVTRQALGRAFRPGQTRKVYTYRLIAADAPEQEDHVTCFRKESIAKMWFEWDKFCGHFDFEMETVSVNDCGDRFMETDCLKEDVTVLSKR